MVRAQLVPGERFDDRYDVVRCLSSGGMGTVYEVIQRETKRRRALKLMHADLAENPVLVRRFALEARVAAKVDSAHVVEIVDARLEGAPVPYIVMELLRGEDLQKVLDRRKRIQVLDALVILEQLASALDKTHAHGIVHRDLKPSNLVVTPREDGTLHVKILDFGVAKVLDETGVSGNKTGLIGTPMYMAPEQINGSRPTAAVDRYALAHIAFSLLTGSAYWSRECTGDVLVHALLLRILEGCVEPATARAARLGVTLPAEIDAWFARGTAVDPARRFTSCAEQVDALAAALSVELPRHHRTSGVFLDIEEPVPPSLVVVVDNRAVDPSLLTLEAGTEPSLVEPLPLPAGPYQTMVGAAVESPPRKPRTRTAVLLTCGGAIATAALLFVAAGTAAPVEPPDAPNLASTSHAPTRSAAARAQPLSAPTAGPAITGAASAPSVSSEERGNAPLPEDRAADKTSKRGADAPLPASSGVKSRGGSNSPILIR
ncbi:MAG: protein kinase [Polyangiaceae bacterium]